MKKLFSLIILTASITSSFAQQSILPAKKSLPTIGAGVGILAYKGDIGKTDITDFSKYRTGYKFSIEQRLFSFASVSLNGLYGKLAQSERTLTRNLNFESTVVGGDLSLTFRFDNGFILSKEADISPFISAGFGYLKFDPHTDIKDKSGNVYQYWSDGSIRNLPEVDSNYFSAIILKRDYTYETKLDDPDNKRSTFIIPLTAGIKFRMSTNWDMSLAGSYYLSSTDYLDNYKEGGNDRFIYCSFGVHYNLGSNALAEEIESKYEGVDFGKLDLLDSDDDGVIDSEDRCQGTPKEAKVDSKGCPKDDDKDGVPDYMDKEPSSSKGAIVDKDGIKITDEEMAYKQMVRDSLATERSEVFNQNPSLSSLQAIDAKISANKNNITPLPAKFKSADINNDGIIQSSEITAAIDAFFEGESDFTVEKINELIDYFFEQ